MDPSQNLQPDTALVISMVVGLPLLYAIYTSRRHFAHHRSLLYRKAAAHHLLLEAERRRLAREIHDDVSPLLSLTGLHIGALRQNVVTNHHADKAVEALEHAIISLGNIVRQLTPGVLQNGSLETTVGNLLHHFHHATAINFRFQYEVSYFPSEICALQLYRIIQELVHNAVKHSGATTVTLHLEEKAGHLRLHYSDNGCGFHWPADAPTSSGLGLQSLLSRILLLGGTFSHCTAPGSGTAYLFTLPKHKA